MLGFEIGRLGLKESIDRIEVLKDVSVFPLDETGDVIHEDSSTHEAAREIRLLLQRVLELNPHDFLQKMRELFFHLFSVDHSHYRDLLLQAARKEPEATRDFCLSFLFSDDVIFIDDQKNLSDLYDVLSFIGIEKIPAESLRQVRDLLSEPFFRRPSLHARTIRFLAPVFVAEDILEIRTLYEMDLVPRDLLPWSEVQFIFAKLSLPESWLEEPIVRPGQHLDRVRPEDLEDIRWAVGLEGTPLQIIFRYLGCLVAAGPDATELFYQMSEKLPETAFHRRLFETTGQRLAFERALLLLREDILRDVHRSREWILGTSEEIFNPAGLPTPLTPWPARLRFLPTLWTEFANPIDQSDFGQEAQPEIQQLDLIAERVARLMGKHPLPSADDVIEAENAFKEFLVQWDKLIAKLCPRLDILP
ncbi:MAG: hypothetical protein KF789_01505 [Bdellovibrionaceae bacterium]|nr:hypothetical protein [Pseudobdellovibrionaceae bacterium]